MPAIMQSKPIRALAISGVLLMAYALVGFHVAPDIVRNQAQEYVRSTYGRELAIGEVRLNPFSLQLDVHQVSLPDADGQPMLEFERLFVDFEVASLWNGAFTFREIAVDVPRVRAVIRPDGALNLADLAPPTAPDVAQKTDGPLPSVWVQKFDVGRGSIDFVDQGRRKPFTQQLHDVGFELADFRTTPQGGDFRFSARGTQAATFEWKGRFALSPVITSQGEFKIHALPTPRLLEFLGEVVPFTSATGTMHLSGNYRVALAEALQLEVSLPAIELRDTRMQARGAAEPWVQVPSLVVSELKAAMPGRTVTMARVTVDALRAQAVLNPDRSVNLTSLFVPAAQEAAAAEKAPGPAAAAAPTASERPWTVRIGDIALSKASIDFEDRAIAPGTKLKIAPLDLSISGASLDLSKPLAMKLTAAIDAVTQLDIKGTLTPQPLAASLDLSLAKARMALLKPYALQSADLSVTAGTLDVAGKVELAPAGSKRPEVAFTGDATVSGFKSIDNALKQDFVSITNLQVVKIRFSRAPDALSIDGIDIREPSARLVISPQQELNASAVLNAKGAANAVGPRPPVVSDPAVAKAPPASTMPISIREVRIDRMRLNFTDNFIQPNFAADIQQLSGKLTGLSSAPGMRAQVALKGTLGEFSPVTISGQLEPFSFDRYTDMQLRFEGIQLPILNPYSGSFTGYNIAKGQLTTELRYLIQGRRLDANHMIRVDQLEWGGATESKQAASLPVRLATSLLKDRNGVIKLDVPVGGTLDDPSLRIGPIVWQVITNIITKAVTAPFAVLGSLFEGAEEAQFVDFPPGDAALAPAAAARLTALGKSLVERPELKLDVPIVTLAELDRPALLERAFESALASRVAALPGSQDSGIAPSYASLDAGRKIEVLSALLIAKDGSVPTLPEPPATPDGTSVEVKKALSDTAAVGQLERALRAAITVPDAELAELGEARSRAVQHALLTGTGLDPARVFKVLDAKGSANDGQVRLALALK